eukprot:g2362.t1
MWRATSTVSALLPVARRQRGPTRSCGRCISSRWRELGRRKSLLQVEAVVAPELLRWRRHPSLALDALQECAAHRPDLVNVLLQVIRLHANLDVRHCNAAISSLARKKHWQHALGIFDEMLGRHGTYRRHFDSIRRVGLLAGGGQGQGFRNHVHFSPCEPGDKRVISGMRYDCEIAIWIDLKRAIADNVPFYMSPLLAGLEKTAFSWKLQGAANNLRGCCEAAALRQHLSARAGCAGRRAEEKVRAFGIDLKANFPNITWSSREPFGPLLTEEVPHASARPAEEDQDLQAIWDGFVQCSGSCGHR